MFHRRLGDLLVDGGFATRKDVDAALEVQIGTNRHLSEILVQRGVIDQQVCDSLHRLQHVLESREQALAIAANDDEDIGERLLRSGQISSYELRKVSASKPRSTLSWVRALLSAGYIDRGRAITCLEVEHAPDISARKLAGMRLGDLLVEHGDLSKKELKKALRVQRKTGQPLGTILREKGLVNQRQINRSLKLQRKLAAAAFGTALTFGSSAVLANPNLDIALLHDVPSVVDPQIIDSDAYLQSDTFAGDVYDQYPELRQTHDRQLQAALEASLHRIGLKSALNSGQLSVALVDITDSHRPRLAEINGEKMRYAASLPKIAILLGAFQKIHDGKLSLTPENRRQLTSMIRRSSNTAATNMLDKVGMKDLNALLRSSTYKLYDPKFDGGLWVGKRYAKSGPQQRDPLHNISHGASAVQVARYFYMLETGQLVSPEACREMKTMLGNPGINHKFVKGLNARPGSRIFRKSGSWRNYHADGAIVERDGRRYVAVALAESASGGKWLSDVIVAMDDVVFDPANSPTVRLAQASINAAR